MCHAVYSWYITVPKDLLTDNPEEDEPEKDDLTLLNEILNAPPTGDDFSREWQAVFGSTPLSTNTNLTPVEPDQNNTAEFMPSNLLDMTRQINAMALNQGSFLFISLYVHAYNYFRL